jgi:YHS domain-containing protein
MRFWKPFLRRQKMNAKKKQLIVMSLLAGLLVVGMVFIYGCKKSEPATTETSTKTTMQGHEHAAMAEDTADQVVAATEQTTCPVMSGAINKAFFTEYKGKKVYFCCEGCKEKFEAEPEKYVAKLPQFKD